MRVDLDRAQEIASHAIDNGGMFIRPRTVAWGVAGKCSNPFSVQINGRPMRKPLDPVARCVRANKDGFVVKRATADAQTYNAATRVAAGETKQPLWVDLEVGCRQCPACLQRRGVAWRERAKVEINCASRTWFGTLTLSPHEHCMSVYRAGAEFDIASPAEQFRLRHRAITPLITKYIKRIRKHGGSGLRILCIAEAHKSGLPHYHALVHEPHGVPVRHSLLTQQWQHGFSKWKLVSDGDKAASYVAKYLFKSSLARVRASAGYGESRTALCHSLGGNVQTPQGVKAKRDNTPPELAELEANGLNERSDWGGSNTQCSTDTVRGK